MIKICAHCGKNYSGRNAKFCSNACKGAATQSYKICKVCGVSFACAPSSIKVCCNNKCSAALRSSMHSQGKYANAETKRRAANLVSPKTAKGSPDHHGAREWVIQSPSGEVYRCRNLLEWLRQNNDLYEGTPRQAWDGISKIKYSMQGKRKRPAYQWRGWRLLDWGG